MKLFNILKYAILLVFIFSMYPWFLWNIDAIYLNILLVGIVLLIRIFYAKVFDFSTTKLPMFAIVLFFIWLSKSLNIFGIMSNVLQCTTIILLLFLREEYKTSLIRFVTRWLAIILGISIIPYLLFVTGFPLPNEQTSFGDTNYILDNYYFFITNPYNPFRFRGPFLEPGHLTLGLAPILYLNRYNIRDKFVLVLLFAQILTFSLAGFIVLFFGFFWCNFYSGEEKDGRKINVIGLLFLFIIVLRILGTDFFEDSILNRLSFDKSTGTIAGDNRTSDYFDSLYDNLMDTPLKWTGIPFDFDSLEQGVAGYKRYVVEYGLIGVFLALFFYISLLRKRSQKYNIGLVILLLLLLYQDSYPLWWCIILCAIFGIQSRNNKKISI